MSGVAVWIHRKIAGALLVVRLKAKPRNIILINVYGPVAAATNEEMERFYQDLSQAVKQVPKRDMLLVMGDFNAKVGKIQTRLTSSHKYRKTSDRSPRLLSVQAAWTPGFFHQQERHHCAIVPLFGPPCRPSR